MARQIWLNQISPEKSMENARKIVDQVRTAIGLPKLETKPQLSSFTDRCIQAMSKNEEKE